MKLNVAGLLFDISGELALPVQSAFAAYETGADGADIRIRFSVKASLPAVPTDTVYGVKHGISEYAKAADRYLLQDREDGLSYATITFSEDFRTIDCELADVSEIGGAPLAERTQVALGQCVLNALPMFGGFTFHASCIDVCGHALMFSAPSGGGKSTQTALWKRFYPASVRYINDDTPILRKVGNDYHAFGSPWAGTSGINENRHAKVRALVYVKQGGTCSLRPMEEQEKMLCAMRSVRMQFFPEQRRRQTALLFEFLRGVPAYELTCDISRAAVETVKTEIFRDFCFT